jgi:hypothetical protein
MLDSILHKWYKQKGRQRQTVWIAGYLNIVREIGFPHLLQIEKVPHETYVFVENDLFLCGIVQLVAEQI